MHYQNNQCQTISTFIRGDCLQPYCDVFLENQSHVANFYFFIFYLTQLNKQGMLRVLPVDSAMTET